MFTSTPIVKKIFYINIFAFVITLIAENVFKIPAVQYLALFPFSDPNFHIHEFITSLFIHANISHLFFNMLAFVTFAPPCEEHLGARKFITFYFLMGIFASLAQMLMLNGSMIGASGAIFGMLIYFTCLNPDMELKLFLLPIAFKAKTFAIFMIIFEIVSAIISHDNVGHWAHLGGALTGFILYKLDNKFQFNI